MRQFSNPSRRKISYSSSPRSEEDNDPLTDDGASAVSIPVAISRHPSGHNNVRSHSRPSAVSRVKHQLASSLLSDSDGVDSPTYDGDVESSTTAGADGFSSPKPPHHHHHHTSSSTSTLSTPITPAFPPPSHTTPINEQANFMLLTRATRPDTNHPVFISLPVVANPPPEEPSPPAVAVAAFNPAVLTPEDIQAFVQKALDGEPWRKYKINRPPAGRPVRVYADGAPLSSSNNYVTDHMTLGVYDLFHFGYGSLLPLLGIALTTSP